MGRKEECHVRIKKAMNLRGLTQSDIVERTNIKKSALSQYISGKITPRQNAIDELSKVLNVSEPWLMGYDVPMERFQIRPDFVLPNGELIDIKYSRKLNKFEFYIRNPENPSSLKKLHLDDEHNQKLKDWISLWEISLKHIQIGPKTLVYLEKLIADIFIRNYVSNEENV